MLRWKIARYSENTDSGVRLVTSHPPIVTFGVTRMLAGGLNRHGQMSCRAP